MSPISLIQYREIWCIDFEFQAPPGERVTPVCLVAREIKSGRIMRIWKEELESLRTPPFPIDADALIVCYYNIAECSCFLSLGWPLPESTLDLFVEFRNSTNGVTLPSGSGLLGALSYYGLNAIDAVEKEEMRKLILGGGPYSDDEKARILDYCQSDVDSLTELLGKMAATIDMPRAVFRGRCMKALARIEDTGIPIDVPTLQIFRENWESIQAQLIAKVDANYGLYEGNTFKTARFAEYIKRENIPWPHLPTGRLALDDETFKQMSLSWPRIAPIRELRTSLSQMRLSDLSVGTDGRNRAGLSAFRATTSRNQPSTSRFVFGLSAWLRRLIKPGPGRALAYLDWSQQEFGIGAALSKDEKMIHAYEAGDPYMEFAKLAGRAPANATKATHKAVRELFKQCVLAVQYQMGEHALALRLGIAPVEARELLEFHRTTFKKFWEWSESAVNHAMLFGHLYTVFGWKIHLGQKVSVRSLRNFPMQANGAEMLRLACCLVTELGIQVCAPIHDALLIEAPIEEIERHVELAQDEMAEASAIVLNGFPLRSDAKIVRYPERYEDERGGEMWRHVCEIISELRTPATEPGHSRSPVQSTSLL